MLVDNGSLANILYYLAFQQMRIYKKRLLPLDTIVIYPQQLTREVTFLVVNRSLAYHLLVKFPIEYGIWNME